MDLCIIYQTPIGLPGPILESKDMGATFQEKDKKIMKKGKILESLSEMFKIWKYFEKGQVIVCNNCMQ